MTCEPLPKQRKRIAMMSPLAAKALRLEVAKDCR